MNKAISHFSNNKQVLFRNLKSVSLNANVKSFSETVNVNATKTDNSSTPQNYNTQFVNKYKSLVDSFSKDWRKISEEKQEQRYIKIKEELLPSQRKFIEIIAGKLATMNYHQINYVMKNYSEKFNKIKTVAPITISEEWLDLQKKLGGNIPQEGTKFTEYEEIMKNVSKWYQSQIPGFGVGVATTAAPAEKKAEVKEEKKEEKKEKETFDIELTAFDQAKKIVLIKEVRALLNLGLKEAKELVEKAPTVLMKGVKRADSEAILKKLKDNGATLTLK